MVEINIFKTEDQLDSDFRNRYYIATYFLVGKNNLREASWNLAIGQSVGNPSARSEFETQELFDKHCCIILADEKELESQKSGIVKIAFPEANINFETDGISQLLVQTMGGQCDIDVVQECHLLDIDFTPTMRTVLKGPVIGLKEMKEYCGVSDSNPLLGGITKPKIGLSPEAHLEIVKKLVDGGVNFIKEDEILSDPAHCPLEKRVSLVSDYIAKSGRKVFYCVSIHADYPYVIDRVKRVHELGGNGVHINFHCGMGVYRSVRELNLPLLVHFQKSGDKVLSEVSHKFHIHEDLLFKLAGMSGCSTLHAGMIGGYLDQSTEEVARTIKMLNEINCVPALSCGMHPGLIDYIKNSLGHGNWMANVGGALTSHPMGTESGTKAMVQAIQGDKFSKEYLAAIEKWGYKIN
jgi:ribulose 1,5-bisphosphate carboxylase large subunit-like protein